MWRTSSGLTDEIYVDTINGLGDGFNGRTLVTNTNVGSDFGIPAQPTRGICASPRLAYDHTNGLLYLVYLDRANTDSTNFNTNVFVRTSGDGVHFSAPIQVNDDTDTNSHFAPAIAVDQSTEQVAVTWLDCRNSPDNNSAEMFGTFAAGSTTPSFASNVQIAAGLSNATTDVGFCFGDYDTMDFVGDAYYAVWGDNSNPSMITPPNRTLPGQKMTFARVVVNPTDTLSNVGGDVLNQFVFTSSAFVASNLTISLANGIYTFHDSNQPITLSGLIVGNWSGSGTNTVTGPASTVFSINVAGGGENSTVNIVSECVPTTINEDSGFADTVNVGQGIVSGIQGALTITNSSNPNDVVTVDDSADPNGQVVTFTVTGNSVNPIDDFEAINGLGAAIEYDDSDTASATLKSGSGGGFVFVNNLDVPTTINATKGPEAVLVGDTSFFGPSNVKDILSSLTVQGSQAPGVNTKVILDDASDTSVSPGDVAVTVDGTQVGAGNNFFGVGGSLTYSGLSALTVNEPLSGFNNLVFVNGTASGTATTINAGASSVNRVFVGSNFSANGFTNTVLSALTINGQGGSTSLTVNDAANTSTPDRVTVTPSSIGMGPNDHFFGTGGSLTYSGIATVTIDASPAVTIGTSFTNAGHYGSAVIVTPKAGIQFDINGNGPTSAHRHQPLC